MKRFLAALAIFTVGYFALGNALLPAKAEAATYFFAAKCQGPTYNYPYKHTIFLNYNNVWKYLVPWCPYPYQHVGQWFRVAYVTTGPWRWVIPA